MYPIDFQGQPNSIYLSIKEFDFTFSSTQLTYQIYLAAKFIPIDSQNVSLVVYIYVYSANDYYVSNLDANFKFNITGSNSQTSFSASGNPSDNSGFINMGHQLYSYNLGNSNHSIASVSSPLGISIEYQYYSSEFNVINSYSTSIAYVPPTNPYDYLFLVIIIIVIVVIIGISAGVVILVLLRRRRNSY